jgi:antitoxin PrlF
MKTIVSEKGQITIPKALRDKLGIRPGTVLDFEHDHGRLVGRKRSEGDVIRKWRGRGTLPGGMGVDAYLKRSRG